jgi:outer membrane protein assembly factor BamB
MRRPLSAACVVLCLVPFLQARGADWPQFRRDASRSAATAEQLPDQLHLQWVRLLGTPRPAFPGEVRLRFDASYEPIVSGQSLFVPSMVTDQVMALDAQTGAQRWRFVADGPVRFAPVAWEDKVYFVSDDGYLYCVNASDGTLRWKYRGYPPGRNDRCLLGNGRLISLFPARGGPVLDSGVIYFGAGMLSGYGVAIHALDAATGKVIWSNTDSNHIPKANMDHGVGNEAGLTPLGYLALVHDMLVVPCGAQLPAFLNRKTGELISFWMGWGGRNGLPKGAWLVAGTGHYLSHGGDLYDLARPNDERFDSSRMRSEFKSMLYPGQFTRLRIDPANQRHLGPFQEPVFASTVMFDNTQGITAHDLTGVELRERKKEPIPPARRDDPYPDKWIMHARELWKMPSSLQVHIKAGERLYLGGPGVVEALQLPQAGAQPQIVWRAVVEGTPQRMIAANGQLFVVTREGALYAFGAEKKVPPVVHAGSAAAAPAADAWTKTTQEILETTKIRDGYALVLGLGTGRLVEELVRQSTLQVIALDADAAKVDLLRRKLDQAGVYGSRASVHVGDPLSFPLPPFLASLVVSENGSDPGLWKDPKWVPTIGHTLRPYGGTACLAFPVAGHARLIEEIKSTRLSGVTARTVGEWLLISRTGPLPGSAAWSHEGADAANTGASEDRFVKAPLELLWLDSPPRWQRAPGATLVRVGGGRILIKAETLQAIDVFTGRKLWETTLPFPHRQTDQIVVSDEGIYLAGGTTCLVLDPVTGCHKARIELPPGLTGPWANLRIWQDYLVGQSGKCLVCLNRSTGRLMWQRECGRASLSVAVGGNKVYCSERVPAWWSDTISREAPLRALDIATGQELWQIAGGSEVFYCSELDRVVQVSGIYHGKDGTLLAALPRQAPQPALKLNAENLRRPLLLIGTTLLFGTAESYVEYDLRTGKARGQPMSWNRRGCTSLRASPHLITTRFRGNAACITVPTRSVIPFWNVRSACSNNLFPADGVLNMPSLTGGCACNYLPVSQAYVPAEVIARGGNH